MANYIPVDNEGKKFLNLDVCLTIEKINLLHNTTPVYQIVTTTGESVIVRTELDISNKIK